MAICIKYMYVSFQYIEPRPGNFIDIETGNVVAEHKGEHIVWLFHNLKLYER